MDQNFKLGLDHKEIMRNALVDAVSTLIAKGEEDISPPRLVHRLVADAMETLKRLRDPEAAWLYGQRSLWPDIARSYEERLAAYQEDIKRWLSGEDMADELRRRTPAPPIQIKRMFVVFEDFPYLVVGKNRRRDYRIMCGLADGRTVTRIAKESGLSRKTVSQFFDLQLAAIAKKLADIMPGREKIEAIRGLQFARSEEKENQYREKNVALCA